MFRSYLRLLVFAFGLLVGVQVPGFIDDYTKRVDAHRAESEQSLLGFGKPRHASSRVISMPWSLTIVPARTR